MGKLLGSRKEGCGAGGFSAKLPGALAILLGIGVGGVAFWNARFGVVDPKALSCSSPKVIEGAKTVFFKALVGDALDRMAGRISSDSREEIESAAGICVDEFAMKRLKSAACAEWLKSLGKVHFVRISSVERSGKAEHCRAEGLAEGSVMREFDYVVTSEGNSFAIRGRLTGRWRLKRGMDI